MIDFKEIKDGDTWELFARDFLASQGFVIELDPSRGADGGKDLVVSEQVSGRLHTRKFTWLVSCKHNATSGKAVGIDDEPNIRERLEQHKCDGFLGFYSTLASTALLDRLSALKMDSRIQDFTVFDGQKIAGYFYDVGLSKLALRYFPKSYEALKPIQQLVDKHVKLECEICGCDWVKEIMLRPQMGIIVNAVSHEDDYRTVHDIFVVCKGKCDQELDGRLRQQGFFTNWEDIEDLCNPLGFLKNCMVYMNQLYEGHYKITKQAHDKQKEVYIAIAQKVLREVTQEDRERFVDLLKFENF